MAISRKPGREESCERKEYERRERGGVAATVVEIRAAQNPNISMPNDRTLLSHRRQSFRGKRCKLGPERGQFAQRRGKREREIQQGEDRERIDERDLVVIIGPELPTAYEDQEARTLVGFSYWCIGAPFLPRKGGASMRSCSAVMPARADQIGRSFGRGVPLAPLVRAAFQTARGVCQALASQSSAHRA